MIKRFLTKDILFKILSLILAVIIWFYIIIILKPPMEVTITDVPIQYVEQIKLDEQRLSVVSNRPQTMDVKIRGARDIVTKVHAKDILATVDLSLVNVVGTPQTLLIKVTLPFEDMTVVDKSPYTVDITVDKYVEVQKTVRFIPSGEVASGFVAGTPKISPDSVTIRGNSTAVNKIVDAVARFDYTGQNKDISQPVKITLLDANGADVTSSLPINKDADSVTLTCPVLQMKNATVVPVFTGVAANRTPPAVSVSPAQVTILGEPDVIKNIEEIKTKPIPVDSLTSGAGVTVELALPDGVSLRDNIVGVTVTLTQAATATQAPAR